MAKFSRTFSTLVKSGESNLTLNGWFLSSTFLGLLIGAWVAGSASSSVPVLA